MNVERVQNFLWTDKSEVSSHAREIVKESGIPYQEFDATKLKPENLDFEKPPILITKHGSFSGIDEIDAITKYLARDPITDREIF